MGPKRRSGTSKPEPNSAASHFPHLDFWRVSEISLFHKHLTCPRGLFPNTPLERSRREPIETDAQAARPENQASLRCAHYCDGGRGGRGAPMFLGGGGRGGGLPVSCGRENWGVSSFSEIELLENPSIVSRRSISLPYGVPTSSARGMLTAVRLSRGPR